MKPNAKGQLDLVITRIAVKSDSPKDVINNFAAQSLRTCFAGEGIMNETEMASTIYLNGRAMK